MRVQCESPPLLPLTPAGAVPSPAPPLLVMKEAIVFDLDWVNLQYFSFWSSWISFDLCCVCGCTDFCIMTRVKQMHRDASVGFCCRFPPNVLQISYINPGHKQWVHRRLNCAQQSQIPDPLSPLAARHGSTSPYLWCPLLQSAWCFQIGAADQWPWLSLERLLQEQQQPPLSLLSTRLRNVFGPIL